MFHPKMPIPTNTVRDDHTTGVMTGRFGNDHLIHHRDSDVAGHAGTGISSFAGNDILEASVPNGGQVHMFASTGDDWMILDVTKNANAIGTQGHHAYGGQGRDTFQFTNIEDNNSPILGRLDDFDPTSDFILIDNVRIDLMDLPKSVKLANGDHVHVRVIQVEHPEFIAEDLGSQYFLAIGDDIFYALDGARDLRNGTTGQTGEERHFLRPDALETLRSAETVAYENPKNFVPRDLYEDRADDLTVFRGTDGRDGAAGRDDDAGLHMHGSKLHDHAHHHPGEPVMRGSAGDDVIDANTGNDVVYGNDGDDLIAGGIDRDILFGGAGDDMIWGGDGRDKLFGGRDDDYLNGGAGDDYLVGGLGSNTLVGGFGNDKLIGGRQEDAVNRFHFYDENGSDVIVDFKIGQDLVTFQDDVEPLTIELLENDDGNTVIHYGQTGSVELRGVSLEEFQDAATLRAEDDDPIITITSDPEEEILRELRIENGHYGDKEPPSLQETGILYGADPFQDSGPGGYTYVSDHDDHDHGNHDDCDHEDCDEDHPRDDDDHNHHHVPAIPPEDDKDEAKNDDETDSPTCFVATAAYRDPWHPDVVYLRAFRDQWLKRRRWGRFLIALYWRVGPKLAAYILPSERRANVSKRILQVIVRVLTEVVKVQVPRRTEPVRFVA